MTSGGMEQGISQLTSALKSNIIPDQEYYLQGSILDSHVDTLRHRLKGLCDHVDFVQGGGEEFAEKELVFGIQGNATQPLLLRLRMPLTQDGKLSDVPWQLRYVGQPEMGSSKHTAVRICYDIACSTNAVEFLTDLGCKLEYQFAARGQLFRKGRIKIIVTKLFQIAQGSEELNCSLSCIGEPLSNSHLVEMSVLAPSGSEAVGEDIKNFAEQLKPLVQLTKIDPRRLKV